MIATLHLHGEIGSNKDFSERAVRRFLDSAEFNSAKHLHIDVASSGGDTDEAFSLYHIIRSLPISVSAEVTGPCESAACIVLMAASFRRARVGANLLVHCSATDSAALDGRLTAAVLASHAQDLRRVDARMTDLLAFRTGADRSWISREMATEDQMSHIDALSHGLLHEMDGLASIGDVKCQSANWTEARRVAQVWRDYESTR